MKPFSVCFQKDSESDFDDSTEHQLPEVATAAATESVTELNNSSSVKTELIDYSLPEKVPDIEKVQSVFGNSFPFEDDEKDNVKDVSDVIKKEIEIKTEQIEENKELEENHLQEERGEQPDAVQECVS